MKIATKIFKRDDWKITSGYGVRIHPTTHLPSFHSGIDFGTKLQNWEIYGLEEGKVVASGINETDGNYIWIEYPRVDLKLFHGHLLHRNVFKGDKVNENTIIGQVGKSGRSTNVHLHLGVRHISDNKYFNFENYEYIPKGEVSGIWDKEFNKLLQTHYKTYVDGIISNQIWQNSLKNIQGIKLGIGGSQLVRAIQRESGYLKVDGYLGKNTISYLQRKYGTKVTGIINPNDETVIAIRKALGG